MGDNRKFWMVWGGKPNMPPTVKQFSLDVAQKEAERLVQTYGGTFYVLEAVSANTLPPRVITTPLTERTDGSEDDFRDPFGE